MILPKSSLPQAYRDLFRKAGAKGGKASAKALTAQQRKERARKAGLAMQANARKKRKLEGKEQQ